MTAHAILTVRHLTKRYAHAAAPAVDGLDFTVHAGEIFGLLGPNGAGKTTAISIACTLLPPTSGTVLLDGIDVVARPGDARRRFGLAPQDIALYPTLTARENLRYFGRLAGVPAGALGHRIDECLSMVGLAEAGGARLDTFSGGMKRRANLAAAIMHAPPLLFLDEPTVGVDAQSRHLVFQNLLALRASGTTIFYTTHYLEEAEHLCDRVAIIDAGKLVAEGTPAALAGRFDGCASLEDAFLRLTGHHVRD